MDKFINELFGLPERLDYLAVDTFSLEDGKEFFGHCIVIEIPDHRQIEDTLAGVDIRNVRDPLSVRLICTEVSVEQILIFVGLLFHLHSLFGSAYLSQQFIFPHHPQHRLGIMVNPLFL